MYHLKSHLRQLGMDEVQVGRINQLVKKWIRCNGRQWVVDRFKMLKIWYVNRLAGQETPLPFVAMKGGIPAGPVRAIFGLKKPKKVLDALMLYTALKEPKLTRKQWLKFYNSATLPALPRLPHIPFLKEAALEISQSCPRTFPEFLTYREYPFTGLKRVPGINCKSKFNTIERLIDDFRCSGIIDLLDVHAFEYVLSGVLDDLYIPLQQSIDDDNLVHDECIGKISCLQERGCKARIIANPKLTVQLACLPLGKFLFQTLKRLPWDCTHDQSSGVAFCKRHRKRKMWCVDLSDASNSIDLQMILRVLQWLPIPAVHLECFKVISRGKWNTWAVRTSRQHKRSRKNSETTRNSPDPLIFTRGQPLGVFPSFPAFALLHGALLRSIEIRYQLTDTFRIVGDDVVISNGLVYWEYRRILTVLSIPVSETKTMVGLRASEFVGNLVFPAWTHRPNKVIHPTSKNKLFRAMREVSEEKDLSDPTRLVGYAHHILSQSNSAGIPLRTRATLLRFLSSGVEDDFISFIPTRDKAAYNKLKYLILQGKTTQDGLLLRESLRTSVKAIQNFWEKHCLMTDPPHKGVLPIGARIAKVCNLDQLSLGKHVLRSGEYDDLDGFTTKFVSTYAEMCRPYKWYIRLFVKNQIRDFEKSRSIVEVEILTQMLRLLESPDVN